MIFLSWGVTAFGAAKADTRVSSHSTEGNLMVFAEDLGTADQVVVEAERVRQHFLREFGLDLQRSPVPISIVFGNASFKVSKDDGVVRVFPRDNGYKLQVNWDETPVLDSSFRSSWVRALCTRLAVEMLPRRSRSQLRSGEVAELRVPIWVTEGLAVILADSTTVQEMSGRATLWARTEPLIPLSRVLAELEGKSELDPSQTAVAAVICRALVRDPAMRSRFFHSLNWAPDMTAKDWLGVVTSRKDLNTWWRGVWSEQSSQISWVKWGYGSTRDWLIEFETLPQTTTGPTAMPVESGMSHSELAGVAHPWFRPLVKWRVTEHERTLLEDELVKLRVSIENRRRVALDWFAPYELKAGNYTREDWLLWDRLHPATKAKTENGGIIEAWFDSVRK